MKLSHKIIKYLNNNDSEFFLNLINQDCSMEAIYYILKNNLIPDNLKWELRMKLWEIALERINKKQGVKNE